MKRLILCGSLVWLLGCQTDSPASQPSLSGVGIVAEGCAGLSTNVGSGMVVEQVGLVATTAHTVAGATSIWVVDVDGAELPATVVAFDKNADLALLDVADLTSPPRDLADARLGDAQAIVWSPDDGVQSISVEVTNRLRITIEDIYVEDEVQRSGLELSGEISVGDSGGAIVDAGGDVVGIIYARSRSRPRTAFATDDAELRRVLAERPLDATDRCR